MKSTHLIYLQKFSDPVNEAVNSISRKKETEKYSNVLSGLVCKCQSNELSVLAQCKTRVTSTVLFLLHQCKNGLDQQLRKFLGVVKNHGLYCNLLLCCSRGEYGFCSYLLGAATDQVPRSS